MKRILTLIFMIALLPLAGCDTFFGIQGIVTDANTGGPIANAKVKLVLDKGVEEPNVVTTTPADGQVGIWINEPSCAWATLTVEKPGYQTWSTQFRGSPKGTVVIRLQAEKEKTAGQKN